MLIRYPGSKDKQLPLLSRHLLPLADRYKSVAEPFSGTAAVTFHLLQEKRIEKYWINDFDVNMASLWQIIKERPDELITLLHAYVPRSEDFYNFKTDPGTSSLERAFRKVVMHQISYSGLGAKAGSPIGGREQKGSYKVDCRWNAIRLEKKIRACSSLLNSTEGVITSLSWEGMLKEAFNQNFFVYLDPPYFLRGSGLYVKGVIDHQALADTLRDHEGWLLSYDNAQEIVDMYTWADVAPLDIISHLHHRKIQDLVVLPKDSNITSLAW